MSQESALCVLRSPPLRPEMRLQIPLIAQYSGYATRENGIRKSEANAKGLLDALVAKAPSQAETPTLKAPAGHPAACHKKKLTNIRAVYVPIYLTR